MEMKLRTVETLGIELTVDERRTIKKVDEILLDVQRILEKKQAYIMALETGEVIDWDDIARARGVIGGIGDYTQWAVETHE